MSETLVRVAIVDDEEPVGRGLERESVCAISEDFLSAIMEPPPDCLLLDLGIPTLSDLQILELLPESVSVVAITDRVGTEVQPRAGRTVARLRKPVEGSALIDAVISAFYWQFQSQFQP